MVLDTCCQLEMYLIREIMCHSVSFSRFPLYSCPLCNWTRPLATAPPTSFVKPAAEESAKSTTIRLNLALLRISLSWVLIRTPVRKTYAYIQCWFPLVSFGFVIVCVIWVFVVPPLSLSTRFGFNILMFLKVFWFLFAGFWIWVSVIYLFASSRCKKTVFSFIFHRFLGPQLPH